MKDKVRALIFYPNESAQEVWIAPNHESLTNIINGEISISTPFDDGIAVIQKKLSNDYELEPNCYILNHRGQYTKKFYGVVLVTGLFLKEGELDSLTDKEIRYVLKRMKRSHTDNERSSK